jgi:membrane protein YdbS with pleckstrin-like domain
VKNLFKPENVWYSMEKLHPGARWIFRIRAYWSMIFIFIFFGSFILPLIFPFILISEGRDIFSYLSIIILIPLLLLIILGEIYSRMSYNRWFYDFTSTNLKIEKGIIWKRYSNVPYERVQNVDISRGILARLLGFSTIHIQTAGYSVSAGGRQGIGSEGYIPAVNVHSAEKIRDFLMKKIGKRQGL